MNQKITFLFLFILNLISSINSAQSFKQIEIPFSSHGNNLELAMIGGLFNPQLSEVDLNNDGIQDLYIFDKQGEVSLCFINGGTSGVTDYTFAPEYARHFPKMNNWTLLRDYDKDGVQDIFTHSTVPGVFAIEVHKGYYENDSLKFNKLSFIEGDLDIIYYRQNNGSFTNLYVSNIDIPAIDDIDGDGDLDILTFNVGGGYLEYFKNESIDRGFGTDSIKFVFADNCWGKFYESGFSEAISLSSQMGLCATGLNNPFPQTRHSGSTVFTMDEDADGDKEVYLGDVSFSNITKLKNGGDTRSAFIVEQDTFFPSYDDPVDLPIFPAVFMLDVDNDGKKDFLAAPNSSKGENHEVLWFYKNNGTNEFPIFNLVKRNFLVDEILDFGAATFPSFLDYNADGLQDLLVGSGGFWLPGGFRNARLFLYENVGTKTQPSFSLVDDDYLEFSKLPDFHSLAPTVGDLDGDGDDDILIGEGQGKLFYAENKAGAGNTMDFEALQLGYKSIDVGQISTPQIIDWNKDGLMDLVIGERIGNLNYYENIGSLGNPNFNSDQNQPPNVSFFGAVDTRTFGLPTGYSAAVFHEFNDVRNLIVGTEEGKFKEYGNIDNFTDTIFNLLNTNWGDISIGSRTTATLADLNGDGLLEMITGNLRGGLNAFQTDLEGDPVAVENPRAIAAIKLFPNPAKNIFYIEREMDYKFGEGIVIYNSIGQIVQQLISEKIRIEINTTNWPKGIYFVSFQYDNKQFAKKITLY